MSVPLILAIYQFIHCASMTSRQLVSRCYTAYRC